MTEKDFLNRVTKGKGDFLLTFLDLLKAQKISFCVIGGLAVNAYADPVVSLDLDAVIIANRVASFIPVLKKNFKVESFTNSVNISSKDSALRIQIQTDERYQSFIKRAHKKQVLGYTLPVADISDVFQGKVWAASDKTRRPSKRQKDLADISRLIEVKSELQKILPDELKKQLYLNE